MYFLQMAQHFTASLAREITSPLIPARRSKLVKSDEGECHQRACSPRRSRFALSFSPRSTRPGSSIRTPGTTMCPAKLSLKSAKWVELATQVHIDNLDLDGFADVLHGHVNCLDQQPFEIVLLS